MLLIVYYYCYYYLMFFFFSASEDEDMDQDEEYPEERPMWETDATARRCTLCNDEFSLFTRRVCYEYLFIFETLLTFISSFSSH